MGFAGYNALKNDTWLNAGGDHRPDTSAILRFRHPFEQRGLAEHMVYTLIELRAVQGLLVKSGAAVDGNIIHAPSAARNNRGERTPEMHQSRKRAQWYFGMKAHVGTNLMLWLEVCLKSVSDKRFRSCSWRLKR